MDFRQIEEILEIQSSHREAVADLEQTETEIREILRAKADSEIMDSKLGIPLKAYMLSLKHDGRFDTKLVADKVRVVVDICSLQDGQIVLEGRSRQEIIDDDYEIFVRSGDGEIWELDPVRVSCFDIHGLDGSVEFEGITFRVCLPDREGSSYSFVMRNR